MQDIQNMPVQGMEPDAPQGDTSSPAPSSSRGKVVAMLVFALVLLVALGAVYYFFVVKADPFEDTPPSLGFTQTQQSTLQGFIGTDVKTKYKGLLQFTEKDKADFSTLVNSKTVVTALPLIMAPDKLCRDGEDCKICTSDNSCEAFKPGEESKFYNLDYAKITKNNGTFFEMHKDPATKDITVKLCKDGQTYGQCPLYIPEFDLDENWGVHTVYSEVATNAEEVLKNLNPTAVTAAIAIWNPATTKFEVTENTNTSIFPPAVTAKKVIAEHSQILIPAYRPFYIFTGNTSEVYGLKKGDTWAQTAFPICEQTKAGWYNYVLTDSSAEGVAASGSPSLDGLSACADKVEYIFIQKGLTNPNHFEKEYKKGEVQAAEISTITTANSIVWVKFNEAPAVAGPDPGPGPAAIGAPKGFIAKYIAENKVQVAWSAPGNYTPEVEKYLLDLDFSEGAGKSVLHIKISNTKGTIAMSGELEKNTGTVPLKDAELTDIEINIVDGTYTATLSKAGGDTYGISLSALDTDDKPGPKVEAVIPGLDLGATFTPALMAADKTKAQVTIEWTQPDGYPAAKPNVAAQEYYDEVYYLSIEKTSAPNEPIHKFAFTVNGVESSIGGVNPAGEVVDYVGNAITFTPGADGKMTAVITKLEQNAEYTFSMYAQDQFGHKGKISSSSFTAPSAQGNLTLDATFTPNFKQAKISWSKPEGYPKAGGNAFYVIKEESDVQKSVNFAIIPSEEGAHKIQLYNSETHDTSPYNGTGTTFEATDAGVITVKIAGLTNDQDYTFTVDALDVDYTSLASDSETIKIGGVEQIDLSATFLPDNSQAVVTWAMPSGSSWYKITKNLVGAEPSTFWLVPGETGGFYSKDENGQYIAYSGEDLSFILTEEKVPLLTVTGLTNGNTYDFSFEASNIKDQIIYTTTASITPLDSPFNLALTSGDTQVELNWNAPQGYPVSGAVPFYKVNYEDNNDNETVFYVSPTDDPALITKDANGNFIAYNNLNITSVINAEGFITVVVKGLENSTQYEFTISALTEEEVVLLSKTLTATPTAPSE